MNSFPASTSEHATSIFVVGRVVDGGRPVEQAMGSVRRRLASFDAALSFAGAERHRFPGATGSKSCAPAAPAMA